MRNNISNQSIENLGKTGLLWTIFFLLLGAIMVGIIPGIEVPYALAGNWLFRLLYIALIVYLVVLNPNQMNTMIAVVLSIIYIGAVVPGSLFDKVEVKKEHEKKN